MPISTAAFQAAPTRLNGKRRAVYIARLSPGYCPLVPGRS